MNSEVVEMFELLRKFEGFPPSNQTEQWEAFESFIKRLVETGWNRKAVFELVNKVHHDFGDRMSEESEDALTNYLSCLIGDVAISCIGRFPGEPQDANELALYVRGLKWRET